MANRTGGHAVVRVLAAEGVKKVFCVPGESYLGVLDGLYQHPDIAVIANRHESGASFMAEAYAKASGQVGVCMGTRGPGAANLTIGLHTAAQDSTPLVAMIGQVERKAEYREGFQELDFGAVYGSICKWVVQIDQVNRIPELLHRAFYVAKSGRPGPVVVVLPHDMLEDSLSEGAEIESQFQPYHAPKPRAEASAIAAVVETLKSAKHPLVIAGGGVLWSGATADLVQVAHRFELPVATSFRRFDAYPNQDEHYAGWLGFGPPAHVVKYIHQADVILALGTRLSQVTTQDYTLFQPGTKLIQVDISQDVAGKSFVPALQLVSDAKLFLQDLLAAVDEAGVDASGAKVAEWSVSTSTLAKHAAVKALHEAYLTFSTPIQDDSDEYVDMDGLMYDFVRNAPQDVALTSDAGNFFGWLCRYYRFSSPKTYFGPTSGAMGYGLPAAIGVKLARPERTVISFSGDGGFMMTMQELNTAVRYQVPIVAIVVNNGLYGTIRAHQERHFPGRVVGTELTNPNFAEVAKLFGCHGERVTRNVDFLPALERALQAGRPAVLEVMTCPEILSAGQKKPTRVSTQASV